MITDHLFLGPDSEVLCGLEEIRTYVEEHYEDRRICPRCGCYLIPAVRPQRFLCRVYRCANSICSGSLKTFRIRIWPYRSPQVA